MKLEEIAKHISANLVLPSSQVGKNEHTTQDRLKSGSEDIVGIHPIDTAMPGYLTFITPQSSKNYEQFLLTTRASAVILKARREDLDIPQLVHENPYYAMAKASQFLSKNDVDRTGISNKADIHPETLIEDNVTVFPFVVVDKGATVKSGCVLYPGVYIGRGASIGEGTIVHANVTIGANCVIGRRGIIHAGTAIGPDGFGFAPGTVDSSLNTKEIAKIVQAGNVVIGDDVEIGGCCTIDRAALLSTSTSIGNGTKLDSHVHVGHNVRIGRNSMLCGVSKIAGSAVIGDWCVLGGDSSVSNGCVLSNGVRIGAKAGVTKNLDEAGDYMGFPAVPAAQWRRQIVAVRRIHRLESRLAALEKQLNGLKGQ